MAEIKFLFAKNGLMAFPSRSLLSSLFPPVLLPPRLTSNTPSFLSSNSAMACWSAACLLRFPYNPPFFTPYLPHPYPLIPSLPLKSRLTSNIPSVPA